MKKVKTTVPIVNRLGLHARAATKLVELTQSFNAKITLIIDSNEADARSIMGLMLLAGSQGKVATVIAEGEDAEEATAKIVELFTARFDEEE
jgi:phosphocarrier protein NPr